MLARACAEQWQRTRPFEPPSSIGAGIQQRAGRVNRPATPNGSAGRAVVVAVGDAWQLAEQLGDGVDLVLGEVLLEEGADRGDMPLRRRSEFFPAAFGELGVG